MIAFMNKLYCIYRGVFWHVVRLWCDALPADLMARAHLVYEGASHVFAVGFAPQNERELEHIRAWLHTIGVLPSAVVVANDWRVEPKERISATSQLLEAVRSAVPRSARAEQLFGIEP